MNIAEQGNAGDVSLDAIEVMAKADGEGVPDPCDEIWDVEYSASVGTSTGGTVTCSTGGEYKCPICIW